MFRRTLTAVVLLATFASAAPLLAGSKMDNTLEPLETTADLSDDDVSATPAPVAETVSYAGEIQRTPANGGAAVKGALSLSISPLGKVTGSITWYNTAQKVKIGGKQDLNTRQGDFIIRDADGARVPGALRMPFRISKKNRLVGGGMADSGEAASFRLNRYDPTANSGYASEGGGTLSLGAVNTYSGATSATISSGTLATLTNSGSLSVSASNTALGGTTLTTLPTLTTVGTLSGSTLTGTLQIGSIIGSGTILVDSGSAAAVTITADGNLNLGSTRLLLGPITTTTGTDGTITYTGTSATGTPATVVVRGGTATGG